MTVAVEDLLLLEGTDRLLLEGADRLLLRIVNPGDNQVIPRVNLLANTGPYARFVLPPYDSTRGTSLPRTVQFRPGNVPYAP